MTVSDSKVENQSMIAFNGHWCVDARVAVNMYVYMYVHAGGLTHMECKLACAIDVSHSSRCDNIPR